jgi:hypothetical protein
VMIVPHWNFSSTRMAESILHYWVPPKELDLCYQRNLGNVVCAPLRPCSFQYYQHLIARHLPNCHCRLPNPILHRFHPTGCKKKELHQFFVFTFLSSHKTYMLIDSTPTYRSRYLVPPLEGVPPDSPPIPSNPSVASRILLILFRLNQTAPTNPNIKMRAKIAPPLPSSSPA